MVVKMGKRGGGELAEAEAVVVVVGRGVEFVPAASSLPERRW